jgi:GDP-4-dehydro-6-deoxy-D-mannose reductase
MNGPVIVTGAAGFAGRHLLADLLGDGTETIAWWNPAGTAPDPVHRAAEWQAVDILDRTRVAEAIRAARPSAIYHCAGAAHVGRSWATTTDTYERNVRGTHHVLEGARGSASTPRILIPGSAAVYAASSEPIREDCELQPTSPYGLSKLAQEMLGRRAFQDLGQRVLIARAFNHLGPGQSPEYATSSFARQIARIEAGLSPPVISVGNLDAARDLTDVRDTVRAYRAVVEGGRPGSVYNVCSGRAWSMRDVLARLVDLAQIEVEIRPSPDRFRPTDAPVLVGDASRLRDELGWAPSIPLDRTLRDLLEDWRRRVDVGADHEPLLPQ